MERDVRGQGGKLAGSDHPYNRRSGTMTGRFSGARVLGQPPDSWGELLAQFSTASVGLVTCGLSVVRRPWPSLNRSSRCEFGVEGGPRDRLGHVRVRQVTAALPTAKEVGG